MPPFSITTFIQMALHNYELLTLLLTADYSSRLTLPTTLKRSSARNQRPYPHHQSYPNQHLLQLPGAAFKVSVANPADSWTLCRRRWNCSLREAHYRLHQRAHCRMVTYDTTVLHRNVDNDQAPYQDCENKKNAPHGTSPGPQKVWNVQGGH